MFARHSSRLLLALALCGALLAAGAAHAIPSFDSLNGAFSFTNFHVSGSPDAIGNLLIEATADGFDIVMQNDAMRVGPGEARDVLIQYDVIANTGPIISASLAFEGLASGPSALASVSEDYFSQPGGTLLPPGLAVWSTMSNSQGSDTQGVGEQAWMHVKKDILVANPFDALAEITRVSQSFATAPIPEPSGGLLFSAGAGLVAMRLQRRNRR